MGDETEIRLSEIAPEEHDSASTSGQDGTGGTSAKWKPSRQELQRILARHRGWLANPPYEWIPSEPLPEHDRTREPALLEWRDEALNSPEQAVLKYADLRGADLSYANLRHADLYGADLRETHLSHVDLNKAQLADAKLCRAIVFGADLSGAHLSGADLTSADLAFTNLSQADLSTANLSGTSLHNARLDGANLRGARLSGAILEGADLTNSCYAPGSGTPDPQVAGIVGLSTIQLENGEELGLVQLRKLLQDAGFRKLEREATYSIERARASREFRRTVKMWKDGYQYPFPQLSIIVRSFRRVAV